MKKTIKNRGSFTTVKLRAISLRLIVIIALAVVIGFSMAACDNGDDDTGGNNNNNGGNNNNNNNGGNSDTGGTFTVTGIPSEYNGKYAGFQGYNEKGAIVGAQTFNPTEEGGTSFVQIANGSVSLPMWLVVDDDDNNKPIVERYSGNDTIYCCIYIFNSAPVSEDKGLGEPIALRYWESVTFSNGSAARTWSSGADTVPEDDDD